MGTKLINFIRSFVVSRKYIKTGIVFFLFLYLILLLIDCKIGNIKFKIDSFYEFMELSATIIGSFTAIVIAFYFVIFQMIDSKRLSYFQSFREEVEKLKLKLQNIPNNLSYIYFPLAKVVNILDNINFRDGIPARGNETWDEIYKPIYILERNGVSYGGFVKKRNLFVDELFSNYNRIEEYLGLLGVLGITVITTRIMLQSTVRLLFNLLYFIVLFLLIMLIEDNGVSVSPIVLIILSLVGLYLSIAHMVGVVFHVFDFYRNYESDYVENEY